MAMKCAYHPEVDAVGACVNCGRLVCAECKVELEGKIYCNPCAERILLDRAKIGVGKPRADVITVENTSGQGKIAVVPREIPGWSWGAFFLSWIWGIGNNVWIALLALIPYAGFIMAIVLGVKGNEWAWRSKRWDGIEHFKRTQRRWACWGIGLVGGSIFVWVLALIIVSLTN